MPAPVGPKTCLFCGAALAGRWKRCGGCRAEYFCSREHFEAAWPAHAAACTLVQAREEAAQRAGGLTLTAGADRALRAARDAAEAAAEADAEAAAERARIEGLDEDALRRELERREIILPAGAGRRALMEARLAAPEPTEAQLAAYSERAWRAHRLRFCHFCEKELVDVDGRGLIGGGEGGGEGGGDVDVGGGGYVGFGYGVFWRP